MEVTEALLRRLSRIEELDAAAAPAKELLGELRELVVEAEAWARREGDERAAAAVERCRSALSEADPAPEPAWPRQRTVNAVATNRC